MNLDLYSARNPKIPLFFVLFLLNAAVQVESASRNILFSRLLLKKKILVKLALNFALNSWFWSKKIQIWIELKFLAASSFYLFFPITVSFLASLSVCGTLFFYYYSPDCEVLTFMLFINTIERKTFKTIANVKK